MGDADLYAIGKRIQSRRKQMGYTQEQLAELMDVSIQMISNLERGMKAIRIDNLIPLCRILQISADYILTGKETDNDFQRLTAHIAQLPDSKRKMIEMLVNYCLNEDA